MNGDVHDAKRTAMVLFLFICCCFEISLPEFCSLADEFSVDNGSENDDDEANDGKSNDAL